MKAPVVIVVGASILKIPLFTEAIVTYAPSGISAYAYRCAAHVVNGTTVSDAVNVVSELIIRDSTILLPAARFTAPLWIPT